MIQKGQLVEIPADSPLYRSRNIADLLLRDRLLLQAKPFDYSLFDGFLIGSHTGLGNFRLGQRKGINAGGKKEPLYVIGTDEAENRVFVGQGRSHPGLWTKALALVPDILNQNQFPLNSVFPLELSVVLSAPSLADPMPARLYVFSDLCLLEAEEMFPITLRGEALTLRSSDGVINCKSLY